MLELNLDVDRSLGKRAGLEQAIRHAVRSGRLEAGAPLPSSRALAADLGFSRATVVGAYEQLTAEGYLTARHGAGTAVAQVNRQDRDTPRTRNAIERFDHDFRPGEPDGSLFPRSSWQRSARNALRTAADGELGYPNPAGAAALRSALARFLARSRAVESTTAAVSVFSGFAAALGFLGEMFRRRGITEIAVEDPTLFINRDVLRLAGVTPVPIPLDHNGLDVAALERSGARVALITPSHQYPMGVTMTAERRTAMVEWANRCDGWIIEDDYDGEFRYDRQPIGALQGLDPQRVIYGGTASKSLIPGLRLGWLVVPVELRSDLAAVKHLRGSTSILEQLTLADFIERGALDRHLRAVRTVYRNRQLLLADALATAAPALSIEQPAAGLHLTGLIADPEAEEPLIHAASAHGIGLMGLGAHFAERAAAHGLVIGYSRPPEHHFPTALERLTDFLRTNLS